MVSPLVAVLMRCGNSWPIKTDHEFHEFHENVHCHLDVIGLKYSFSQSLRPRRLTPTFNCTAKTVRRQCGERPGLNPDRFGTEAPWVRRQEEESEDKLQRHLNLPGRPGCQNSSRRPLQDGAVGVQELRVVKRIEEL